MAFRGEVLNFQGVKELILNNERFSGHTETYLDVSLYCGSYLGLIVGVIYLENSAS